MTTQVIQLAQLEEFVQEDLHAGNTVRVVILDITETLSAQVPGLRSAAVGVHIRAFNNQGHILACYLPVARIQLYNGRREADPTWRAYDQAWAKAEALKARVIAYLEPIATEKGFTIRAAGVIDIGAVRPLRASWKSDPVSK